MKKVFTLLFAFVIIIGFSLDVHAELFNRGTDNLGNRLIYDSDLNITWYDYTNTYDTWENQMSWASTLSVNFGGTVYDDWRLPYALNSDKSDPCGDYNCHDSEFGHLYYMEMALPPRPPFGPPNTNTDFSPFVNILENHSYWTSNEYTEYTDSPTASWLFSLSSGMQYPNYKYNQYHAMPVRDGDVGSVVAEPIIIDIDIKPRSYPNKINLKSKGIITVAILTTDDFDALLVDPSTVVFGPNKAVVHGEGHFKDVDKDGDLDLVLHFRIQKAGILCNDITAGLMGATFDGQVIEGGDSIHIVKCKKSITSQSPQ